MSDLAVESDALEGATPEPAVEAPVDPLAGGVAAGEATDGAEPVAAEPVAPAQPEFDPREYEAELEYVRSQNEQLLSALQQYVQTSESRGSVAAAQEQPDLANLLADEFGNLNPAGFAQYMQARDQALLQTIGQQLEQISAPMQAAQEAERLEAGHQNALDMIGDEVARNGEFASTPEADAVARQRVYNRAEELLVSELQPRYGATPRAAEIAIARAAAEEREYLRSVRGEAASTQANRLATLAGAAAEPGGASGGVPGKPTFKNLSEIREHYARQARELGT